MEENISSSTKVFTKHFRTRNLILCSKLISHSLIKIDFSVDQESEKKETFLNSKSIK